jgi:hypothetical protein
MQARLDFNQRDLGHGAPDTILHPVVAVALVVTIALILWRPRKYAIASILLCIFLVPRGQEVLLLGAHLYVCRILVLTGFIRAKLGKFRAAGGWNAVDKLFVVWLSYRVFASIVTNWPNDIAAQVGFLLTAICGYFLFRCLFQGENDLIAATKALAVVAVILGLCMVYEHQFGINPFGTYLGGAPTLPLTRDGTVRAQATFGHSILAGCFGATLIPLFVWLWKKKLRVPAAAGIVGSTLMVLTANSSTPVLAYVAGLLGILLWPFRRSMKAVRWGIVIVLVAMAMAMNAPVWFVIAHINVIGGSGGYDRAFLIDNCMRHFEYWWLIGTNQNANWGYDMWDMSNQFVAEAETGGIVTLICFIAIITKCFGRLGGMRKLVSLKQQWLYWCLGSIMLANIFAFFGVAYWDQTQIWWFAFLAMICAVTVPPAASGLTATAVQVRSAMTSPDLEKAAPVATATIVFKESARRIPPWVTANCD